MQKNDIITLDIIDIASDGSGVGRFDGMAIFVPMTAIGDKVNVKILKVKKNYAYGKIEDILTPSKDREENNCPVYRQCGGCVYRHLKYTAECEVKYKAVYNCIKRIAGIDLEPKAIIPSDNSSGYRNKAQFPIGIGGKVGFFAPRSHRIIPCERCELQPQIFNGIINAFSSWAEKNNISIYNEEKHSGLLRHIYIRSAEKTSELLVCIVINGDCLPCKEELVDSLKALCGENLRSIQLNINKKKTNVILGDKCSVIYGDPYITDIICGVKIRISPLSFYQVNRATAEKLYNKATEYADADGKDILDLYCGAGAIGLSMAKKAKTVIGVEIIDAAVKDAEFNAKLNGIKNARFICADAAEAAKRLAEEKITPYTVIVDPPRKGCDEELITIITDNFAPKRVVYVSCDPATLARDIKIFAENGYELIEYTPVDMFPRTAHVETVALLLRK